MTADTNRDASKVDLEEARQLIEALERDLAKVQQGSGDVDTLRGEVERLRAALDSADASHDTVHTGLRSIRAKLHSATDEILDDAFKASQYVTQIGRMLGM